MNWDIETMVQYTTNSIRTSYEGIHGLTTYSGIIAMLGELVMGWTRKLHIYVKHGIVVPQLVEAAHPPLRLTQLPAKVIIDDYKFRDHK